MGHISISLSSRSHSNTKQETDPGRCQVASEGRNILIRDKPIRSISQHTAHQIGALQFQLQKILFGTSQKCRDGQQTLISCTSFQILHLQLAVLFQTKSPMSTFSVSGPKILSHIMPRSADDDTVFYLSNDFQFQNH